MQTIRHMLTAAITAFIAFTVTAFAAGVADPADSQPIGDLLQAIFDSVRGGDYWLAGPPLLILVVALVRRYGKYLGAIGRVAKTKPGGATLNLMLALGATLGTALAAPGVTMSAGLFWSALKLSIAAAGGYTLLKQIAVPALEKLRDVLPAKAAFLVDALLWIFRTSGDKAVEDAEKAGDKAVAAKPGEGASSVVGEIKDVD